LILAVNFEDSNISLLIIIGITIRAKNAISGDGQDDEEKQENIPEAI
jgi:hypothetical protein